MSSWHQYQSSVRPSASTRSLTRLASDFGNIHIASVVQPSVHMQRRLLLMLRQSENSENWQPTLGYREQYQISLKFTSILICSRISNIPTAFFHVDMSLYSLFQRMMCRQIVKCQGGRLFRKAALYFRFLALQVHHIMLPPHADAEARYCHGVVGQSEDKALGS